VQDFAGKNSEKKKPKDVLIKQPRRAEFRKTESFFPAQKPSGDAPARPFDARTTPYD